MFNDHSPREKNAALCLHDEPINFNTCTSRPERHLEQVPGYCKLLLPCSSASRRKPEVVCSTFDALAAPVDHSVPGTTLARETRPAHLGDIFHLLTLHPPLISTDVVFLQLKRGNQYRPRVHFKVRPFSNKNYSSCEWHLLIDQATRLTRNNPCRESCWLAKKCGEMSWCVVTLHPGTVNLPNQMWRPSNDSPQYVLKKNGPNNHCHIDLINSPIQFVDRKFNCDPRNAEGMIVLKYYIQRCPYEKKGRRNEDIDYVGIT